MASLMLAAAILGSSYLLARSIDRGGEKLRELTAALAELPSKPNAAPARKAARAGRPDPGRHYEIALAGAPSKGPRGAPVTIVGWADFQ